MKMSQLHKNAPLLMAALSFPCWEEPRWMMQKANTMAQLWSYRRNSCPEIWVLLRFVTESKKCSFQLMNNILNYYLYSGSNWEDSLLVLGRRKTDWPGKKCQPFFHFMSKVNEYARTCLHYLLLFFREIE